MTHLLRFRQATKQARRLGELLFTCKDRALNRGYRGAAVAVLIFWAGILGEPARGQLVDLAPAELSDAIRVDEPDAPVRTQLERVRTQIAAAEWDDAIEGLEQLASLHGEKIVPISAGRFVTLRTLCNYQLAGLPAAGRQLYRKRVDASARRWYEDGIARRDETLLRRVVDEFFASSFGDNALWAVGEIALERGHPQTARDCWERIHPDLKTVEGLPRWTAGVDARRSDNDPEKGGNQGKDEGDEKVGGQEKAGQEKKEAPPRAREWLAYPDSEIPLSAVRARLVVASLMEGSWKRADAELAELNRLHPDAVGRLAGREGKYREILAALRAAGPKWGALPLSMTGTTFAGAPARTFNPPGPRPSPGPVLWQAAMSPALQADASISDAFRLPRPRVAEAALTGAPQLLSTHPLIVGNLTLVSDRERVYAWDLRTGKAAWPRDETKYRPGQIYGPTLDDVAADAETYQRAWGVPRFTLTVHGDKLFARLGSQVTSRLEGGRERAVGEVVCLDLAQEGREVGRLRPGVNQWYFEGAAADPDADRWAFAGAPLCDGANLYVVMRYGDVRPQVQVACIDLQSGKRRWRRMICAAESPARGAVEEISHEMLTAAEGVLYCNTNLGAVAALSAEDGQVRWISTYPRARGGAEEPANPSRNAHFYRDLNPAVYYRGSVYAAPSDAPQVFAFDAGTGAMRWASIDPLGTANHLLGAAGDCLIASGRQLWWLDLQTGKVRKWFPENLSASMGYGRGLLCADAVLWPTRERIHLFQQDQPPPETSRGLAPERVQPLVEFNLGQISSQLSGGNLVYAPGKLLIATPDRIWCLGPRDNDPPEGK